jgi:hypothetical protein
MESANTGTAEAAGNGDIGRMASPTTAPKTSNSAIMVAARCRISDGTDLSSRQALMVSAALTA